MPPKRKALSSIDGNTPTKIKTDPEQLPPKPPAVSAPSKALIALATVTPTQALATLQRLIDGYTDKSGSGYPAAATNLAGCVLVQKGANR